MEAMVLERVAAEWARELAGLVFRGALAEPSGARLFFGPGRGGRGPVLALAARWPEPLWLWLEEAALPKERERVEAAQRYEGRAVGDVRLPTFDRRVRVALDSAGGTRGEPAGAAAPPHPGLFWEIEAWPPGNAVLVEERRGVLWVARRRPPSSQRPALVAGAAYAPPPPAFRRDPRAADAEAVAETLLPAFAADEPREMLAACLAHHWAGVPGPLARHAAAALFGSVSPATGPDAAAMAERLREWAAAAYAPEAPVLALRWRDKHRSATLVSARLPFVPGPGVEVLGPWPGWAEAARAVAAALPEAIGAEELAQARARVRRVERALEAVGRDLAEAYRAPEVRRQAEALTAYATQVPRRVASVTLPDPSAPERKLFLELDPALAPHQNAARYFKRAAKLERALDTLPARRRVLEEERRAAFALLTALEDGHRPPGVTAPAVRTGTLSPARPARSALGPRPAGREDIPAKLLPRRYRTREGWEVWIGKTNEGNDYLTHRLARPEDYWFHVQGSPGSHVVLRRGKAKDEPSRDALREVAAWAAFFSRQRTSGTVPVIYVRKKYVRKPRGAKPGLAEVIRDEKTLFVKPAEPPESTVIVEEDTEV
jgi:hypothetical protein